MKGSWQRKAHRTTPQMIGHRCRVLQYIFYKFKHAGAQKIAYVMCDLCKILVPMNSKT